MFSCRYVAGPADRVCRELPVTVRESKKLTVTVTD